MLRLALVITVLYLAGICRGYSLQLKPYNETAIIMFLGNDLNRDGHIDRSEINATFSLYDKNSDGYETRYEYTEYICGTSPALYQLSHYLFDEYDFNGDHILEEYDYEVLYDQMDKDKDGLITPGEFIDYWERVFPKYENVGPHPETLAHGPSSCH
ncbi:uncharacterized protein LOC123530204 [Mercenaria mercenaria]|uniref:uncharacterized protein LOC123530204 n=1 Tax=Mercenaria mercenaria TaxID=6596 RepID=UPI00234EDB06|nr:uncharacterized protein LOC123530204 [Mercenaria mercenaria]